MRLSLQQKLSSSTDPKRTSLWDRPFLRLVPRSIIPRNESSETQQDSDSVMFRPNGGNQGGYAMLPETLYALTEDGWSLALHHWPHHGRRRRHPILMVHGLGANRIHFDLDENISFARSAQQRGFDVYVLELRGAGLSRAPDGCDRDTFQWGFGEYSTIDLPAAVRVVLEHSGAPAVHGLGHSMGGMLFYALGSRNVNALRSICAIGAPVLKHLNLGSHERRLLQIAASLTPGGLRQRVPLRRFLGTAGRLFIPLSGKITDGILLNAANVEPHVLGRVARDGIDDVPLKLFLELTQQMFCSEPDHESPFAHEFALERIVAPTFMLSGTVDRVAPPASVAAAMPLLRAADVRYREMGLKHGDRADYGHVDLLVGRNASKEVYPLLLDFIEEVD